MKLNGLKEEHYFDKTAPKDNKICLDVMFESIESFVGLCFRDLESETHWLRKKTVSNHLKMFGSTV